MTRNASHAACRTGSPAPRPHRAADRGGGAVHGEHGSTVIATSLPAIAADIGTSPLALKLAITSYLFSLAVFLPVSGWTADRFGARRVFRTAIVVFMCGSIGCALSGSLTQFVLARMLEGMGGAMMTPVGG